MTNKERYQKTFGALHASPHALEELTMNTRTHNTRMPKLLVLAACLAALLATTAFAANEATDGALAHRLICIINGEAIDLSGSIEENGTTTYTDGDVEVVINNETTEDCSSTSVAVTAEGGEDGYVEFIIPEAEMDNDTEVTPSEDAVAP